MCYCFTVNDDSTRAQLCPCHDSSAVVACAILWPDCMIEIRMRAIIIFTSFQLWAHTHLVKWTTGPRVNDTAKIHWNDVSTRLMGGLACGRIKFHMLFIQQIFRSNKINTYLPMCWLLGSLGHQWTWYILYIESGNFHNISRFDLAKLSKY